jgi:uncharacterized RDD family membrane protein YckC
MTPKSAPPKKSERYYWVDPVWEDGTVILLPPSVRRGQIEPVPGKSVRVLASAGDRLWARFLDALVLFAGVVLLAVLGSISDAPSSGAHIFMLTLVGLWALLYEPVMTTRYGGGLGKLAAGIRVVRSSDPRCGIGIGQSAWRYLAMSVLRVLPLVGLLDNLWLLWDRPLRQCLHDKLAATIVVRTR